MRDVASAHELIGTARALLRDELLAVLPAEKRHGALMVANALAIAARQLESCDADEAAERASLRKLMGEASVSADLHNLDVQAQVRVLNRRLIEQIRAGSADRGRPLHTSTYAHLLTVARGAVEVSNPKYLAR